MRPFLREPLTYDEKEDADAQRLFDRVEIAIIVAACFLGTAAIWLIYNGKLWP